MLIFLINGGKVLNNVIVMVGPTASGKTKISIELAKILNGEIISADSMQIYKYMDIGTAKPTIYEMEGIKHHLIDEIFPSEEFSVAKFKELATKYIIDILDRGKLPIVVGGTGLYINSLIYNIDYSETTVDWNYRNKLKNIALEQGNGVIYEMLRTVDKDAYDRIHQNDINRIIRALEVHRDTNIPISTLQDESRNTPSPFEFCLFGLRWNREILYQRINKRVDIMIETGLIDETKNLITLGFREYKTSMQAIAYKEMIDYIEGNKSLEDAIDFLKQSSRRYAKRQLTWFKRLENINWIDLDEFTDKKSIVYKMTNFIENNKIIS